MLYEARDSDMFTYFFMNAVLFKKKNGPWLWRVNCSSLSDRCTDILLFLVRLLVQLFWANPSLLLIPAPHTARQVSLQAAGESRPSFVLCHLILLFISHSPPLLLQFSIELLIYTWVLQRCSIIFCIWRWVWFASPMRSSTSSSIMHQSSSQLSTRFLL